MPEESSQTGQHRDIEEKNQDQGDPSPAGNFGQLGVWLAHLSADHTAIEKALLRASESSPGDAATAMVLMAGNEAHAAANLSDRFVALHGESPPDDNGGSRRVQYAPGDALHQVASRLEELAAARGEEAAAIAGEASRSLTDAAETLLAQQTSGDAEELARSIVDFEKKIDREHTRVLNDLAGR